MVALVAALLAVLAGGIWLGGHPAQLPPPLRDAFVDESGGLTAEATELIEDNYFREVSEPDLIDSSLSGMVRGLRRKLPRSLLRILLARGPRAASTKRSKATSRGSASP